MLPRGREGARLEALVCAAGVYAQLGVSGRASPHVAESAKLAAARRGPPSLRRFRDGGGERGAASQARLAPECERKRLPPPDMPDSRAKPFSVPLRTPRLRSAFAFLQRRARWRCWAVLCYGGPKEATSFASAFLRSLSAAARCANTSATGGDSSRSLGLQRARGGRSFVRRASTQRFHRLSAVAASAFRLAR